ncbi:MAG: class I SAM-dependent methyltransferase [Candidatus Latescibacterota bacterium]|nr:MAG: class I SAM-dependent methyltransferase [Candidatus Latescibacterota bacterium]
MKEEEWFRRKMGRLVRRYTQKKPERLEKRIEFLERSEFPRGGIIVEIGVRYGLFSELLLEHLKPERFYLIDPWKNDGLDPGESRDNIRLEGEFRSCVARFRGRVPKVLRAKSADAAFSFADEDFDFVYIDGNHTYEFVLLDCLLWWPKVKKGGFLAGHDYEEKMRCDQWDPRKAVDRFAKIIDRKPTTVEGGTDWWIRR